MTSPAARFASLADLLAFQLPRAAAVVKSALEAELEPLGLRASEATLLIYLGENPGRTQAEIGRDLRVKPANMAPLAGRLAAAGLVERVPGEGRAIPLTLTEAGRRKLQDVRQALQRQEDRLAGEIPPEQKTQMLRALRTLIQAECGKMRD